MLIFKESKNIFVIDDYYYIKSKGYQDEKEDNVDEFITKNDNKLLIERHRHICDDQKLVDASQNFSDFQKIILEEMNNNAEKNKSQELKIYESLKKFKDVEAIIKEVQKILNDPKRIIKISEMKSIYEKYKTYKYYPDNYSMFKLQ